MKPSLLLSPDGSRNTSGPVTPTVEAGVTVVAGQYGQAWSLDAPGRVYTPVNGAFTSARGTILFRYKPSRTAKVQTSNYLLYTKFNSPNVLIARTYGPVNHDFAWDSDQTVSGYLGYTTEERVVFAYVWTLDEARTFKNGTRRATVARPSGAAISVTNLYLSMANDYYAHGEIEGVVCYPVALTDAQVATVSALPEAWTWENLTLPSRRIFPVLKVGSQHIGPLRAGKA